MANLSIEDYTNAAILTCKQQTKYSSHVERLNAQNMLCQSLAIYCGENPVKWENLDIVVGVASGRSILLRPATDPKPFTYKEPIRVLKQGRVLLVCHLVLLCREARQS